MLVVRNLIHQKKCEYLKKPTKQRPKKEENLDAEFESKVKKQN
jgi:hypothetical protein